MIRLFTLILIATFSIVSQAIASSPIPDSAVIRPSLPGSIVVFKFINIKPMDATTKNAGRWMKPVIMHENDSTCKKIPVNTDYRKEN